MRRRSTLVLLAATAAAGALPDGQQSNGELIAALRAEKRPARSVYKSSVSELEERQRSVGASIEYVDDLSAAYRWSPVFRAGIGIDNPTETLRTRKGSPPKKQKDYDPVELGKTQRCGFSWDDAAAKCGPPCPLALDNECNVNRPKHGVNATYIKQNYTCYSGLPYCNPQTPLGTCYSKDPAVPDDYCTQTCNTEEFVCNHKMCVCDEHEYPLSTPIESLPTWVAAENMTERTDKLVEKVKLAEARQMGLPECLWKPGAGCTNHTPYECLSNARCSHAEEASCNLKCLHVSLLNPAPYYALWRPGPLANPKAFRGAEARIPHYTHDNMKHQLEFTRNVSSGSVMMSSFCKKKINGFVGTRPNPNPNPDPDPNPNPSRLRRYATPLPFPSPDPPPLRPCPHPRLRPHTPSPSRPLTLFLLPHPRHHPTSLAPTLTPTTPTPTSPTPFTRRVHVQPQV